MAEAETHDPAILAERAQAGDGVAAHRLAVMTLIGLGVAHDPGAAWRWLETAATVGDETAQGAADLIRRDGGLASWLTPPSPAALSDRPHVLAIGSFLSPAACQWVVQRARPVMARAEVYDNQADRPIRTEARSNSAVAFPLERTDFVLAAVRERIARATGLPVAGLEPTQVLHYAPGEAFDSHHDYLDPARPGHRADLARNGQRMATFLVYLNDGYEGGETEMASIGLKHRARRGDALFWANVTPDGKPDPSTLHAGLPPTSGEKWVLSQWLRNRAPTPA